MRELVIYTIFVGHNTHKIYELDNRYSRLIYWGQLNFDQLQKLKANPYVTHHFLDSSYSEGKPGHIVLAELLARVE